MTSVFPLRIPMVNVNDETVVMVEWLASHGQQVRIGQPICVVETSKAATEIEAEQEGVLWQIAEVNSEIRIGSTFALIGPDTQAVESYLAAQSVSPKPLDGLSAPPEATPRASALARERDVSLEQVAASGIKGTIKESDVRRFLSGQTESADQRAVSHPDDRSLPRPVLERTIDSGQVSRHDASVAENLRLTLAGVIAADVESIVDLTAAKEVIAHSRRTGTMLTLLHMLVWSLGKTLPDFPRLISFHHDGRIYRYSEMDIGFIMRDPEGRLFSPVIRKVDSSSLVQVASACHAASLAVFKGNIRPEELEGACFTVSHVTTPGIVRFTAIPNRYQSAILAVAPEHHQIALDESSSVREAMITTLTLTYDHTLCDATYAAEFLQRLTKVLESVRT